ncbi:MAG: cation-translocating P-type ATPase [Candidatus Kariarchaeaceae archaeon]|jgi:Ca2+-transporting ATPase
MKSINEPEVILGYELSLEEISLQLNTDLEKGLSEDEVEKKLLTLGRNEIVTPKSSVWKLYLAPLFDILIVIYLVMTGILLLLSISIPSLRSKVSFWLIMIFANMILAIFQQYRAQKKIEALQELSPPKATVVREGIKEEVEAIYLVPGDLIELALGDRIPADARIISSSNLTVNEASLTGESEAAEKFEDGSQIIEPGTPIAHHQNMTYLGTFIQTGSAKAVVVRTGNHTELGKIASAMSEISIEIPLRKRVNALGKGLGIVMISFLSILLLFVAIERSDEGSGLNWEQFADDLSKAIITAMAVLPINIPLLTTVVLITGVLNMATKRVVIKELSVVETLGRCSVLASDKTGTMTTSRMTVKLLYDTEEYFTVWVKDDFKNALAKVDSEQVDEVLNRQIEDLPEIKNIESDSPIGLLLTTAILNNDATIVPLTDHEDQSEREWGIIGNATDGALCVLAMTYGFHVDEIRKRYVREKSYPFDSKVKRMSGLFADTVENDLMVLTKGATEVILPRCTKIGSEASAQRFTKKKKAEILEKVNHFANDGYRVISLAYKPINELPEYDDKEEERAFIEDNLTFIGFSIIYDPPRPGVSKAVHNLDSAGIFPIMITGDAPTTAATIAKQVGILDPDEIVVEGREAETLPDRDFFKVSVFARVSPHDKEIIVSRYQNRGDVVAMTGDGVNDALAITKSDAGVAMGITGTEVAKEAADIIISDDSYVSLVEGVREGRNLYEKIRIMIFFYIAVNLAEAIMYFSTSFDLDFYLVNDWQRVYIFSFVHSIPVLAIIFGPPDKDIMTLKPRDNDALLTRKMIYGLVIYALFLAGSVLSVYFLYYNTPNAVMNFNKGGIAEVINYRPAIPADALEKSLAEDLAQAKARTMLLSVIYLCESFVILSIRRINKDIISSIREDTNRFVWFMVLFAPVLHFLIMYITPLQEALFNAGIEIELIRLHIADLLVVFILASLPIVMLEMFKWFNRKSGSQL